ncbi:MAG: Asparagine synthetase [glutamine-hydrolyzing] 1 [bacterium]|nr:Asparagine synthetase [glutamine-hydrolyzing] 1 [bacterium]
MRDNVALGHRRLAIIDLETGKQPMSNEDGSVWITFNGEIYNYKQLRSDLLAFGHIFATSSDTEVIIHAYEQWGTDCLQKLRGMFAFAIADFRKRKLFLARDHFGIKPLCYRVDGDSFSFASEISALRSIEREPPNGSLCAVEMFLRYQYIPTPHTICQNIFKLPPASYLEVSFDGKISEPVRYWDLEFAPQNGLSDEQFQQRFAATLRESVSAHLVSDVPFGVFLSGGIDSTLVAFKMRELLERPVHAFSIGFEESDYSELKYAEQAARQAGIELYTEIVKDDALHILPELIRHYGEPFGDSSAIPTWYVCRLARSKVPMVLSGDGGDEAFAGYNSYHGWMRHNPLRKALGALKRLEPQLASYYLSDAFRHIFPNSRRYNLAEWMRRVLYFTSEERRALWRPSHWALVEQPCELITNSSRRGMRFDRLSYAQYLDIQTYLPCDILTKVDVASMYHGLEVRTPLVDLNVINLARHLPVKQRLRRNGGHEFIGKYILKEILAKQMGRQFVYRRKQGFSIPRDIWLKPGSAGHDMFQAYVLSPDSRMSHWFDMQYVRNLMFSEETINLSHGKLWLLLVLGIWLSQNNEVNFT